MNLQKPRPYVTSSNTDWGYFSSVSLIFCAGLFQGSLISLIFVHLRVKAGVRHFKVLRDGAGKYFLWIQKFNSLNSLVTYHQRSSASRSETIFLRPPEQARVRNTFIPPEVHICNYYFLMKVKAAFDFEAKEDNELSFKSGDLIMVLASSRDDWWTGMCKGKVGMFPRTYVYH